MSGTRIAVIALIALALAELAYFYPLIGTTAASHFGFAGNVNAYQSKSAFFATWVGLLLAMGALAFAVPALLERTPAKFINLPNKEYWLSPQRRGPTMRRFADHFAWFTVAGLVFEITILTVVMRANLTPEHELNPLWFWTPFGLFLVFFSWWLVRAFLMFQLPSNS